MRRAALIAAACLGLAGAASAADVPTPYGEWELTRINGARPAMAASLRLDRGQLSGRGFCNGFGGAYQIRSGRLLTREVASTRMACSSERPGFDPMAAEQEFFRTLRAQPRLKLGPEGLFLRAENGSTLQFRRSRTR